MTTICYNCMKLIGENESVCPHCGQAPFGLNQTHQLKTGAMLQDRYLIGKAIGQGGFGITYIGWDSILDLRVAIKEYYPNGISNRNHEVTNDVTQTSSSVELYNRGKLRFLQEAKTLARFNEEPGVVSVRDFFEANNTAYIVMEYLDGITLKNYVLLRGKLLPKDIFPLMHPIMKTLEKVHAQGIVHRDISPDNIMVLRDRVWNLKLLDFGAAREISNDKSLSVMLKPGYAPEEQYRSKGKQGPWTDVYALCATMYYCLTAVRPEEAPERVWEDKLKRPSELGVQIFPAQESVLMRGMSVRPDDRYQTMGELRNALEAAQRIVEYLKKNGETAKTYKASYYKQQKNHSPENCSELPKKRQRTGTGREQKELDRDLGDVKISPEYHRTQYEDSVYQKKRKKTGRMKYIIAGLIFLAISIRMIPFLIEVANEKQVNSRTAQTVETAKPTTTPELTVTPQPKPEPVDADALFNQGRQYEDAGDYANAMEWYRKAADVGNADAMNNIGLLYYNGFGVAKDYVQAMEWYRKAADTGYAVAMYNIGWMYYEGHGVTQDYAQAMGWFRKAADAGDVNTLFIIGLMYEYGVGVAEDQAKAKEWYQKAADAGNSEAKAKLTQPTTKVDTVAESTSHHYEDYSTMIPQKPTTIYTKALQEEKELGQAYSFAQKINYISQSYSDRFDSNGIEHDGRTETGYSSKGYSHNKYGFYYADGNLYYAEAREDDGLVQLYYWDGELIAAVDYRYGDTDMVAEGMVFERIKNEYGWLYETAMSVSF